MNYLGLPIDYSKPKGADALFEPTSLHWQVFKNPVVLGVGGIAAVLLELAEPRVRHGVWDHSTFRTRPFERMKRTGTAAMITVYAPKDTAVEVIRRVGQMHALVRGETPCGQHYRASDPELLTWVSATASFGFIEAYSALIVGLPDDDKDRYYGESARSAALYGAVDAPHSLAGQQTLFASFEPRLEPSDILQAFISLTRSALPGPNRFSGLFVRAAVNLLPEPLIEHLGLTDHRASPRAFGAVRRMAQLAERTALPGSPACLACKRVGLPGNFLHKKARRLPPQQAGAQSP